MQKVAYSLFSIGAVGILLGGSMFGDIGLAAWIGAASAIASGVGFLKLSKQQ